VTRFLALFLGGQRALEAIFLLTYPVVNCRAVRPVVQGVVQVEVLVAAVAGEARSVEGIQADGFPRPRAEEVAGTSQVSFAALTRTHP
jgi:hypothetical protein